MTPKEHGTIRRCGFAGVGVTLWRKCATVEVDFEVSYMLKLLSVIQGPPPAACKM